MNNYLIGLEITKRKIAEFQQQAEHDRTVKEFKEAVKEQRPSFWQRLTRHYLYRKGKPSASTPLKTPYGKQAPSLRYQKRLERQCFPYTALITSYLPITHKVSQAQSRVETVTKL